MTDIYPFVGTRYNTGLIEDLKSVISPPYDLIPPEKQKELRERNPYNVMHLVPPLRFDDEDDYNNAYLRAASTIQTWRRDGILVNDSHKSLYLYEEVYATPVKGCKRRRGLFALINLNRQQSDNLVVEGTTPYTNTTFHLNLLRSNETNLAPVTTFFHDQDSAFKKAADQASSGKPWEQFTDDSGNTHRIWVINKKDQIAEFVNLFREKECSIVEGHQRYEVAMRYRNEQREVTGKTNGKQPFDYIMVFLSSFEMECVSTQPVHRLLSSEMGTGIDMEEILEDLSEFFNLKNVPFDVRNCEKSADDLLEKLSKKGQKKPAFCMVTEDGKAYILTLKSKIKIQDLYDEENTLSKAARRLDVNVLYHYIIRQAWVGNPELDLEEGDIIYLTDPEWALNQVARRKASAAFLLNPCPMDQLTAVLDAGDMIPPFAARLDPPLPTGLVIRDMSIRH